MHDARWAYRFLSKTGEVFARTVGVFHRHLEPRLISDRVFIGVNQRHRRTAECSREQLLSTAETAIVNGCG